MKKYAEENGISYKYYQPQEGTTDSYLETIGLAIEGGAKLVVCPGFLFEEPVYLAQDQYKDVHFILLDGEPHSGDYSEYRTEANTMPILFQEDEPGFLAGYAAVKDGYTKLGFLGGMAVPALRKALTTQPKRWAWTASRSCITTQAHLRRHRKHSPWLHPGIRTARKSSSDAAAQ